MPKTAHEPDEIKTTAELEAAFYGIVHRTSPRAAFLYDDFHKTLESALIRSDIDIKTERETH